MLAQEWEELVIKVLENEGVLYLVWLYKRIDKKTNGNLFDTLKEVLEIGEE